MNKKILGYTAAIISAVSYGTNPFFGIHLYRENIGPLSVLFYRFLFASAMLAIYMLITRKTFRIPRRLLLQTITAGVLLVLTCLTWYSSFRIMDSGIGAAIMFIYPVMVAIIMILGFREKLTWATVTAIVSGLAGVSIISYPGAGAVVNLQGVIFALLSGFFFAIYIVMLKVTRLKEIEPDTLTLYTMGIGALIFLLHLQFDGGLQLLKSCTSFLNVLGIAFFPSLLSFLLLAVAIKHIGPTKSSIIGALEPVTAVVLGITVFQEKVTWCLIVGIVLILSSVYLIVCGTEKKAPELSVD